jgi:hypothetical protein
MYTLAEITDTIGRYRLGDYASIFSLLVAVVGFIITIKNVLRSKSAAEQARQAVAKLQDDIILNDTVSDLSQALAGIDEIKRVHRKKDWEGLLRKCGEARRLLVRVKASNKSLAAQQEEILNGTIQQLIDTEGLGERAIAGKKIPTTPEKLNRIMSIQEEKVQNLLIQIKKQVGR